MVARWLVSNGGSVFKAKQALEICYRLGIAKHQIDQGQAWQNYIVDTLDDLQHIIALNAQVGKKCRVSPYQA